MAGVVSIYYFNSCLISIILFLSLNFHLAVLLAKCMEYQGKLYDDKKWALEKIVFVPKENLYNEEMCGMPYVATDISEVFPTNVTP